MRHIKLQGLHGAQPAKEVQDLVIGDVVKWNYGYKSVVVAKTPSKSGKMITCKFKSLETGTIGERLLGARRLVAVEEASGVSQVLA